MQRKVAQREQVLWDSDLPGFGLRCSPSGKKPWIACYRQRRVNRLATLADARKIQFQAASFSGGVRWCLRSGSGALSNVRCLVPACDG